MKVTWNQSSFPLLLTNHSFIRLLILSSHSKEHLGVESILAKIRRKFWVPQARKIINAIKTKCKIRTVSPDSSVQQLIYLAHLWLRARSKGEHVARQVIFNCLITRAVYLDLADGYDADSFILVILFNQRAARENQIGPN